MANTVQNPNERQQASGNADSSPLEYRERNPSSGTTDTPFRYNPSGSSTKGKSGNSGNTVAGSEPSNTGSSSTSPDDSNYTSAVPDEEKSLYTSSSTARGRVRLSGLYNSRRKKIGLGVAGVGISGSILLFSFLAGPFEFIHIAQLLEQNHFGILQNQQNDRFMHEVRYWHYANKGEVEKTRLGLLGNKVGDHYEGVLNNNGLKSIYSDKFGVFNGYEINTTDPDSPFYPYRDDPEALAAAVKDSTGLDVVKASSIKGISADVNGDSLMIPSDKLGYLDSLKLNSTLLQAAGLSKLSAANGARLACVRNACTSFLHPMTKLATQGKLAAEEWLKNLQSGEKNGATAIEETAEPVDPNNPGQIAAADEFDGIEKEPAKFSLDAKTGLVGAGLATGIACIIYSTNNQIKEFKFVQVVQPLIRVAVLGLGMGSQTQSGQDTNTDEMSAYSTTYLHGKDSAGNQTGWDDAATFGGTVQPDSTLKDIGSSGGPFDGFVNKFNSNPLIGLGTLCSTGGQVATGVLQFGFDLATGGLGAVVSSAFQGAIGSVAIGQIQSQLTSWLSGSPLNLNAAGADFGNMLNYGAALEANDQALAYGGGALSTAQSDQLSAASNAQYQAGFANHSLAYKLFNPSDENSTLAKLIDHTSTSPKQNINSVASFLNFGHVLSSVGSLFSPHVHADTGTYNYGFPTYGFSAQEMQEAPDNPYKNADDVADLLSGNATFQGGGSNHGKTYVDMARTCFGVTMAKDTTGSWDVTSSPNTSLNVYDAGYDKTGCSDDTDSNWLKVRFFIMDTETMNSMACYAGDDSDSDIAEACTDTGYGDSSATAATSDQTGQSTTTTGVSGSAQQLAQQILSNKNIDTSYSSSVLTDLQDAAAGKVGTAGAMTSSAILKLIATVGQGHKVGISAIQSNGQGHCGGLSKSVCPDDPHYTGDAVDFDSLDGVSLTGRDSSSVKIINIAESILPAGSRFGQSSCGAKLTFSAGFSEFDDTCNHLHVDVPKGTP